MPVARWAIVAAWMVGAFLTGVASAGAAPGPNAVPEQPKTAKELEQVLLEKAGAGTLTDEVLVLFKQYADASARERFVPAVVPEDFWAWVASDKLVHDALLVELHPKYEPGIPAALKALRDKFGKDFDSHKQLALAFAVVHGRAPGKKEGDAAPSCEESFDWYLQHEPQMKVSLKTTPWLLLAFVADNNVSIAERQWALENYGAARALEKIYYDVPYDYSRVGGKPGKIAGRPYTLPNIRAYGGVCGDRAYFASHILKTLGVPAMYDRGEGQRGGHAWLAWIGRQGKGVDLLFSGRFDYDKYYRGVVECPLTRKGMLDREVQLLTAAIGRSYDGLLDARFACHLYDMVPADARKGAVGLLDGAIRRNPYCPGIWRRLADAVVAGLLTQDEGEKYFDLMFKAYAQYPDLTFEVLEKVLQPRFAAGPQTPQKEITRNLNLLEGAFQIYEKCQRPDLAVKLRGLPGAYLDAVGQKDKALKLYVLASERYVADYYGFVDLFDRALALMDDVPMRLKYLQMVAERVPEYQSDFNRRAMQQNPVFVHVVKTYAEALHAAGNEAEALRWEVRIRKGDA